VGGAGLVWDESEADAELLAESIHRLTVDRATAAALAAAGCRRYREHFANAVIEQRFVDALDGLL
jgi:hypothetical protein